MEKDWIQYIRRASIRSLLVRTIIKRSRIFSGGKSLQKTRDMWESFAGKARIPSYFELRSTFVAGVNCNGLNLR